MTQTTVYLEGQDVLGRDSADVHTIVSLRANISYGWWQSYIFFSDCYNCSSERAHFHGPFFCSANNSSISCRHLFGYITIKSVLLNQIHKLIN